MFTITESAIRDIVALNHGESRVAWLSLITWMRDVYDEQVAEFIHHVPPKGDLNYRYRTEVNRGILICLDVLSGIFRNPEDALETVKIIEESINTELKNGENPAT